MTHEAFIIVIFIILLFNLHQLYIGEIFPLLIKDLLWSHMESIRLYISLIKCIGVPHAVNKCEGGNTVFAYEGITIIVYDTDGYPLTADIPVSSPDAKKNIPTSTY